MKIDKPKISERKRARRLLLQALYQWQLSGMPSEEIATQFLQDQKLVKADGEYFSDLLRAIPKEQEALDEQMKLFLDRGIETLDPIELAILRLSVYELLHRPDVPYRVIINEALELAKAFGATESHKYVNGVLDKVANKHRSKEKG